MTNWQCSARRDLPVDLDAGWDGAGAEGRLFEHFGWQGDTPPDAAGGKARTAFLLYDADNPGQKGGYKLPFADIVDGELKALASGLQAAASRLPQTDEVSDAQRAQARDVLDGYFARLHDEQASPEERAAGGVLLGRIPLSTERAHSQPSGPDDLPDTLLRHIYDPSVLQNGLPFIVPAHASTGEVDSYGTRMLPSTLRNFAGDAAEGISVQNSHRTDELPLGRTFDGHYKAGPHATQMDIYLPRNLNVNGVNTDDVINGVRWGTVKDVSVGFYGGTVRCSLCRKDMLGDLWMLMFFGDDEDGDVRDPAAPCLHIPGVEYPVRDAEGHKTTERAVAIGEIDDAHCGELSFVFKGATPGAATINGRQAPVLAKAQRMAELGVLSRPHARAIETRMYRHGVRFPDLTLVRYPGFRALETPAMPKLATPAVRKDLQPHTAPAPGEFAAEPSSANPKEPVVLDAVLDAHNQGGTAIKGPAIVDEDDVDLSRPGAAAPTTLDTGRAADTQTPEDLADDAAAAAANAASAASSAGAAPTADDADADAQARESDAEAAVRAALVDSGLVPEDFDGALVPAIRAIAEEVGRLRPWAEIGQQAREALVADVRTEGVRALGQHFTDAVYEPQLRRASYAELRAMQSNFAALAAERLKGGRATSDDLGPEGHTPTAADGATVEQVIPDSAYRTR